jgi:hypothetical protein
VLDQATLSATLYAVDAAEAADPGRRIDLAALLADLATI